MEMEMKGKELHTFMKKDMLNDTGKKQLKRIICYTETHEF